MAVPVQTAPIFKAGVPAPLFAPPWIDSYDASQDGKRFLVQSRGAEQGSPPLVLLAHWTELLKR